MQKIKQLSYFAADGRYGDAGGLTIIDTSIWLKNDFLLLEEVESHSRPLAARAITEWIERGRGNSEQDPESFTNFDRVGIKYNWID